MSKAYHEVALRAQAGVLDAIPKKWRLPTTHLELAENANVVDVPRTCGILSPEQIAITEQTATELLSKLASGKLSSVEVTEAFCARAAIAHQLTNCLMDFFPEKALRTASALDDHLAKTGKPLGPLHGLPVCLKDMWDCQGHRSTFGFVTWYDQIAEKDAVLVKHLRASGAVFHAKTTMPQTGMMLETKSNLWGTTHNPYNRSLLSGGSSGGDGVLVAMRGSPISPSTDIGGSIRVPAAYNGNYSIKPTAERVPRRGLKSPAPGNLSIKVSCGPQCHSVADMKMFTQLINASPASKYGYEPGIATVPWREVSSPSKLSIGLWEFDGVVKPQPPIQRALKEAAQKLIDAGHEVIPVNMPFDCWEVLVTTRKLFFQTGFEEGKAVLDSAGEEMMAGVKFALQAFNTKMLSVTELFACNNLMGKYKVQMTEWWNSTISHTSTSRPIDAILCPSSAVVGSRHDTPGYVGYTSLFNILDYPAATIPWEEFNISESKDPKDPSYNPLQSNPYDALVHEAYDSVTLAAQPMSLQIVGRSFEDEETIEVTAVIDRVLNPV
ncbi:hypothetical protein M409DRAFT_38002 [Zasmidium cellare ATCC 36951]|uniref:Amidase domain-containing protein n=1 Tax=Zasmidium cellare ATCC 36951 TaxID=1080233 RepID=A0A6A6BW47_ZASCE|nr:uncharacterized protein M409DRAFT_38002 [Zasmidium cellare ATCC 36951]KAF2159074.1 hypothetical protein M409DRAFT_38002 [Zasmidium cellare ATCC 36951]